MRLEEQLSSVLKRLPDCDYRSANKPYLNVSSIFETIIRLVFLQGTTSVEAAADQSRKTDHEVSGDTIGQALAGKFEFKEAFEYLSKQGKQKDHFSFKLPSSKRKINPACIDGTDLGTASFVALSLTGKTNLLLELKEYSGGNDELNQAKKLAKNHLPDSVSHLLLDGLYANKATIDQLASFGVDPVVKLKSHKDSGQSRNKEYQLIKAAKTKAKGTWKSGTVVEKKKRGKKYTFKLEQVTVSFDNNQYNCLVAQAYCVNDKGEIKHIPEQSFFVFSTDLELNALDLWHLAKKRWEIENNVFKRLNQIAGTKAAYFDYPKRKKNVVLLCGIGYYLLQALKLVGERQIALALNLPSPDKLTWQKLIGYVTRRLRSPPDPTKDNLVA